MTLKEIAQEAGVSISTVSRVINQGNSNVASKEVQDRIWEIVRRTGYIPNSNARNLEKRHDFCYDRTFPFHRLSFCQNSRRHYRSVFFPSGPQYRERGFQAELYFEVFFYFY